MGIVLNRPSETSVESVVPQLARSPAASRSTSAARCRRMRSSLLADFTDPEAAAWIVVADVGLASPTSISTTWRTPSGAGGFTPVIRAGERVSWRRRSRSDSWIVEAPLPAELFPDDPATLWSDVLARKGGQYALIARMPADPSHN